MQTKVYDGTKLENTTDYSGAYVYENNKLSYTNIQGGRIVNSPLEGGEGDVAEYQYHLTDHLGNVRVTFKKGADNKAKIIQEDHYYPFGMRMNGQSYTNTDLINKFLYNGKELQDQTGMYDYGFRQMDVQLGRWHVVDALAEKYFSESPYSYTGNDPINYIDILGLTRNYNPNSGMWEGVRGFDWTQLPDYRGDTDYSGTVSGDTDYSGTVSGGGGGLSNADVDAFYAMGGGEDGSSVSGWYAHGGRAGLSLGEYGAINNILNDPTTKGHYGHDGNGTLYSLTIDGIGKFTFGKGVKVSSVINNGAINWGGVTSNANNLVTFAGVFGLAEYAIKGNELQKGIAIFKTGKLGNAQFVFKQARNIDIVRHYQAAGAAKWFKLGGRALTGVGTALYIIDAGVAYSNGDNVAGTKALFNAGMSLVMIAGPVGFVIGAVYFIGDAHGVWSRPTGVGNYSHPTNQTLIDNTYVAPTIIYP